MMPSLVLKPGRDKSLLRHHPWVFSGAISRMEGNPGPGETVNLLSSNGQFLARAAYSPESQIRARVWTFNPSELVDVSFFRRLIRRAIKLRLQENLEFNKKQSWKSPSLEDACRLIYAESDGIPGLIVDRYADILVIQSLAVGIEYWKEIICDLLVEETNLSSIYERSDVDIRELEGLPSHKGLLRGDSHQQPLTIIENELKFLVNIETGQKTGFFLDQRQNRQKVRWLAKDRDILDCFCYTGGFTVNALAGGAKSVLSVDSSVGALEICKKNVLLNSIPNFNHVVLEGDVFQVLRKLRDEARSFDLIILDPPKFASNIAQVRKAARGYKDINLLAFKLLNWGGILVTFSCSGGMDASLFQKVVASAALDAAVDVQILNHLEQSPDHPLSLNFPEGAYLKGLICRKV